MAKPKTLYLEDPAPILNDEHEETFAAIDEGIRDADAGRVVPAEKALESLPLRSENRPDIKELLLGPAPRFEGIAPERSSWERPPAIDFSGLDFK
jgi:hypothetical protein